MKKLIFILILGIFISCSNKPSDNISGVWYHNIPDLADKHYFEAHITNQNFVVINDVSVSYASKYKIKADTLIQEMVDLNDTTQIMNQVKFLITINNNKLHLQNVKNPEAESTWIKVKNTSPFDFINDQVSREFIKEFRNRYKSNYLEKYLPEQIERQLKDFNTYWTE